MSLRSILPLVLLFPTLTRADAPNVLFLFADDQRADAVAALGHPTLHTPNLDKLVQTGFTFTNAYCMGSNMPAVCTPSRNMLLSGRAFYRWKGPLAPADGPSWAASMKAAGYETYHHGKRGNTALNLQKHFDHSAYIDDVKERTSGQPGKAIADAAIHFLTARLKRGDKKPPPFFLYLAFEAPHDPRVAAKEFRDLYTPGKIPLPANFLPQHPFDNGELNVRDEKLAKSPRTEAEIRGHLQDYYAVITGLDHHIGRLLAELRRQGLDKNTILVFSSDHGLAVGSHGLMGKQSLYEHSMKVPMILAGPGIAKGKSDALVYLLDLFPTICDLTKSKYPDGLDGVSLAGILAGKSTKVRDTLFLTYRDVQRAVRDERWKLIRYPKINRSQLFDLKNDPHEKRDLSGDAAHARERDRLMDVMRAWQKKLGDV
jgi:arylsulfatase A-like enzyme